MATDDGRVCVIMAGGAGTRFWPASTEKRPKQFLKFFGDRSLLQHAWDRAVRFAGSDRVLVMTADRFVPLVQEQLRDLKPANIIGEPMRRDTAAAIALAVALVEARFGDPTMAVLTSDQLIEPAERFAAALESAAKGAASSGALYTFGIRPTYPATGFGYLELGDEVGEVSGLVHRRLDRFVEKPNLETAEAYLASGRFLWNSGMFVWQTKAMAAELDRLLPAHLGGLRPAVKQGEASGDLQRALVPAFEKLTKISIDFGVMEKAREVRCLDGKFDWSDVGGFVALDEHLPHDDDHNAHRGQLVVHDSHHNIVFCDDEEESVALLGVSDLVVVRAGKRTLICPRDRAEDIKQLVNQLPPDDR